MKTRFLLLPAMLLTIIIFVQSNISVHNTVKGAMDVPEDVQSVLDNKCFGCHNSNSQADKAKDKLMLDKLDDLSKAKKIAILGDIADVSAKGEMPPKKFLEQKPEKKLTAEEQILLTEWANAASDDLLK